MYSIRDFLPTSSQVHEGRNAGTTACPARTLGSGPNQRWKRYATLLLTFDPATPWSGGEDAGVSESPHHSTGDIISCLLPAHGLDTHLFGQLGVPRRWGHRLRVRLREPEVRMGNLPPLPRGTPRPFQEITTCSGLSLSTTPVTPTTETASTQPSITRLASTSPAYAIFHIVYQWIDRCAQRIRLPLSRRLGTSR